MFAGNRFTLAMSLRMLPAAILFLGFIHAQPAQRPKIGIALEGGGAKGLAHISVLQWIEDHRIPVDFIAGTSMGGLIAGFYAIGYRPAQIREIVDGIDWNAVLSGSLPYQDLSYRRKEDMRAYPNFLELGLRGGLSLPGGLNSGQSVLSLFDRYMFPYSAGVNFDDLPIPFRCVATNLVSGKPKIFSEGPLADALRATMAIPGVFAPVRQNGEILADGGLLDNLPTDVAKHMGADIVIGVHLNVGPVNPKKLRSALEVARGATDVMIDANVYRGIELSDILITIDVSGFDTLDFGRAAQIIPKGYEAAQSKANILSRLSLDQPDWNAYLARRESRRVQSAPPPQFIEVRGTTPHLAGQIEEALSQNVGKPVDDSKIREQITELMGLGRSASIGYSMIERGGKPGLLISVEEKLHSPPWLKPGFEINGSDPRNVGFTFASRITFLDTGGYRSEARIDLAAGSTYGIRAEYYHPFTPRTRWFIAPAIFASNSALNLYLGETLLAEYRETNAGGGIDLGYNFDRFTELRVGYTLGYMNLSRRIGSPVLESLSGRTGAAAIRLGIDHLDNPIVPRRGTALFGNGQWVDANPGAKQQFPSSQLEFAGFLQLSKPASLYTLAEGGTTFGYHQTGLPQFSLGGPSRLAAFGVGQYLVNQYFYFRLGYLHRIAELPAFLGKGIYVTGEYEIAKPYGVLARPSLPTDGAIGLVAHTLIGPLLVGGAVGNGGNQKFFFNLGRLF